MAKINVKDKDVAIISVENIGIFQMTIKVVDKYTKYFVKGDTTPVKINFFKENLQ